VLGGSLPLLSPLRNMHSNICVRRSVCPCTTKHVTCENIEIFGILTAVLIKIQVLQSVTPYQVIKSYLHFGGRRCLHLQGLLGQLMLKM